MKLYVDLKGDRHFLMTDDGEAVYVEDLEEDGRDTEYLEQTIESAWRHPRAHDKAASGSVSSENPIDVEVFDSE